MFSAGQGEMWGRSQGKISARRPRLLIKDGVRRQHDEQHAHAPFVHGVVCNKDTTLSSATKEPSRRWRRAIFFLDPPSPVELVFRAPLHSMRMCHEAECRDLCPLSGAVASGTPEAVDVLVLITPQNPQTVSAASIGACRCRWHDARDQLFLWGELAGVVFTGW